MTLKDVNLYHLYISIPSGYEHGSPVTYRDKSVGLILDEQDVFELIVLQDWITDNILKYIDWDLTKPITTKNVAKALELFANLHLKPTNCTYREEKT